MIVDFKFLASLRQGRIKDIEGKLSNAQIIDITKIPKSDKVIFGTTVVVVDDNNKKVTYKIVGEDEADIKIGKLSVTSPISRSLVGKNEGETVLIKTPSGEKEYEIIGSSFKGYGSLKNVIGNWWNHDILETDSQITPLSGSIKRQIVKFVDKENIMINNKNYSTDHYKIISKDPNTPEDKKLNFDIWYNKQENLILRIVYNKMGYWEYNVVNFEKN